jgi:uncharacterized protein DUF4411
MPQPVVVWVFDTSSVCEIRREFQNTVKAAVFQRLSRMVSDGLLIYPPQVVDELERGAEDKTKPDAQLQWAKENAPNACYQADSGWDEIAEILAQVPTILDPDKDSGEEEADPYVLALAVRLRAAGIDARIVTQERKDIPTKMSLNTAAGLLGVPSVPLNGFVLKENILERS